MSVHHIHLIGATSDAPATFLAEEVGEECCLICTHGNLSVEGKASDFFEALCLVRLELEKHRLIPFCYGASLNVYPSGMARDMSAGLKAYKLRDGRHARSEDLVEIFEQGPDAYRARSLCNERTSMSGYLLRGFNWSANADPQRRAAASPRMLRSGCLQR